MRRTNNRKRNKINLNQINRETLKTITLIIVLLIVFSFIYFYFIRNIFIKKNFEKEYTSISSLNEDSPFSLNKIILFSSATTTSNGLNNSVWNQDISQYCDICIYLNNNSSNVADKNIAKQVYIDNISISTPELGSPCLYKKSVQDFGKSSFSEDKIISDRFDFNIIDTKKTINYDNNDIYNNLSTPLSIGFYNKNIKTNFLNSDSQIESNGRILKKASIPEASIICYVSFNINIVNMLGEKYICNVNFSIPFTDEISSIYEDGYIKKEISNLDNYKFLRIQ